MTEFRITKGAPQPEELAALAVALLAAAYAQGADAPPPEPSGRRYGARRHALRRPCTPGPHAWRESTWNLGGLL
ncbi:acyl-CoA carboxylase epsilon subunit [Streptosporangium sp. NPDC049644]|uniref:acyl-CoA carboxylase epsilon subunit n=1 Tax=Streptosporangium sp. NPDC049644 TaxID=3155507 RepID=UPI0034469BCE